MKILDEAGPIPNLDTATREEIERLAARLREKGKMITVHLPPDDPSPKAASMGPRLGFHWRTQ